MQGSNIRHVQYGTQILVQGQNILAYSSWQIKWCRVQLSECTLRFMGSCWVKISQMYSDVDRVLQCQVYSTARTVDWVVQGLNSRREQNGNQGRAGYKYQLWTWYNAIFFSFILPNREKLKFSLPYSVNYPGREFVLPLNPSLPSQLLHRSINQKINQSINHSINQRIHQLIK